MRSNPVKHQLQQGGRALGTFVLEFCTPGIGRLAAHAGAEFVLFDMEHTGWSLETIRTLIATTRATDLVSLVRVPATEYHFIARALDVGAQGIMIPMCDSAAQAQALVTAARYPPGGRRGAAFAVAHDDYAGGDIVEKMQSANRETLLVAQIETAAGLQQADAIAAVDGIDVLWIGHFDLSNSLGIPGQFDQPRFQEAVSAVLQACARCGKAAAMLAGDLTTARRLLDQGFRLVAYGGDLWLYQAALRDGLAALRAHAGMS